MFFAMYVGPAEEQWRRHVEAHARWLGLRAAYGRHGGLTCAQLSRDGGDPDVRRIGETLHLTTMGAAEGDPPGTTAAGDARGTAGALTEMDGGDVHIFYDPEQLTVRICLPPATPEQIVFRRRGAEFFLANDLRLIARTGKADLDAAGLYSLFQFGVVPAPLTALAGVQRAAGAHTTSIELRTGVVTAVPRRLGSGSGEPNRFESQLDELLDRTPKGSVLSFSGGVDSGLLAARFVALGRRDITLLNYSFGAEDPAAELAAAMARRLDLDFEQVTFQAAALPRMLDEVGRDYSRPFGDFATMPSNLLVHAGVDAAPDAALFIDGTGADCAFATDELPAWRRLYRVPVPLRAAVSTTYALTGLWRRVGRLEHRGRIIRRSVQMPLLEASMAHNSLDGILYRMPRTVRSRLSHAIHERITAQAPSSDIRDQYSWLGLVHFCSGLSTTKIFDPLRRSGVRTGFPYLEPSLLREAFAIPWEAKRSRGVEKLPLKVGLANVVGADMVYRPKYGFVPPLDRWMTEHPLRTVMRDVAADLGPLRQYVDQRGFRDVVKRATEGRPLTQGVKNFVWVVSFTKLWLDQQPWFSA